MMKKLLGVLMLVAAFNLNAQSKSDLIKHYNDYYKEMKTHGDVQGVIGALTHLNILEPTQARRDTLAALYMNNARYLQAINVLGIESNPSDTDFAIEIKAVSLQELNQPARALVHYNELFKRRPNIFVAYELAELSTQLNQLDEATKHIEYGMANSKDDFMRSFTEGQGTYQVPVKAAFLYLKSLVTYKRDPKANIDAATAILDQALQMAPQFNLATISKEALLAQKGN